MAITTQVFLIPIGAAAMTAAQNSGAILEHALDNPDEYSAAMRGASGSFETVDIRTLRKADPCSVSILRPPSMKSPQLARELIPSRHKVAGLIFKPLKNIKRGTTYQRRRGSLQSTLSDLLTRRFSGEIDSMARKISLASSELDHYLKGGLPTIKDTVLEIAACMKIDRNSLVRAWEADAMDAIDFLYPIGSRYTPLIRDFIGLVRRATVRLGGLKPVKSIVDAAGGHGFSFYKQWNDIFAAKIRYPNMTPKSKFIGRAINLIVTSGTASEAEMTLLFEEMAIERKRMKQERLEVPVGTVGAVIGRSGFSPILPNAYLSDPYEATAFSDLSACICRLMRSLPPRHRRALMMRLGLGAFVDHTLAEAASEFGCTRENVRKLELGAIEALKRPYRMSQLEPFAEEK
jgi:hypothetical protein